MKVTGREVLFSVIILSLLVWAGIEISEPITSALLREAIEISQSHQVKDSEKFNYLYRTEAGMFLGEGELEAVRPKTLPEIPGQFLEIRKVREKYTRHTETYTRTDGKGHTTVHTRTYHSWDENGVDKFVCDSVRFLGQVFSLREVDFRYFPKRDTIIYQKKRRFGAETGDIRFVYYTWPESTPGVLRGKTVEKKWENLKFIREQNLDGTMKDAEKNIRIVPIVFWIFWTLLISGVVFGFYYLENRWLEDG